MKQIKYRSILTALAAVMLLAAGCSKSNIENNEDSPTTGKMVSVELPIDIAELEASAKGVANKMPSNSVVATKSTDDGFTVSYDEPTTATTTANTPSTRTIAQELTNVWVLQFNSAGTNISTTNIGTLAYGALLTIPSLMVGTDFTLYVVANGTALGLTTSNPATLAGFETQMLHTAAVTDATKLPMAGKLTGVSVIDLGDGTGKLSLTDASPLKLILTRIHAEIKLTVDFAVADYALTGAQLYNLPIGATYGWNSATPTFPNNTVASNFAYTDTKVAGMESLTTTTIGSKTTYKWFIGDNRRGEVTGLTTQPDRNSTKAPAYSTFARVTLTNRTTNTKIIYYDIYLGSGALTNFDVMRNHTYVQSATIKGTADFHEALVDMDYRVSGTGFTVLIFLTDSEADSPIVISPKSMESKDRIEWGQETSTGALDIFNGKANTDAIMANSATAYFAAKHCRDQGAKYYLPAQAELMLMWICLPAIPSVDLPPDNNHWSSTESSTNSAWYVDFSYGGAAAANKSGNLGTVRCVREL